MHRSHRFLLAALPAVLAACAFAAPDDDLFSSTPGAKPTVAVKPAAPSGLPAVITATLTKTGESGVETWQLPGIRSTLHEVTYLEKNYAAGTSEGVLIFSSDGLSWATTQLSSKREVTQILHDGRRWVAVTSQEKPYLHYSTDGKTWTPNPEWSFFRQQLAVKDGRFWATGKLFGGYTSFTSGEIESTPAKVIRNWDGQLNRLTGPDVVVQSRGKIFTVLSDGQLFSSDNGDYWTPIGPSLHLPGVSEAFLVEGNDRALLFLLKDAGKRSFIIQSQVGGQSTWDTVKAVPFDYALGLAYGGGRFVAIGTTASGGYKDKVLYESTDGLTWTRVAALVDAVGPVAFGPSGFILGGLGGQFYVYHPAALPEKPTFVREATPMPSIRIKDFGRNYSGKGKHRKETGPQTPDQIRAYELDNLLTKALSGDVVAKREIAMATIAGSHAESNPWMAEKWLKEAIAAGDPIAPRGYAELLNVWKPDTRPPDLVPLYRQSAERGDVPAMVWLVENTFVQEAVSAAERKKWAALAATQDAAFVQREKNRTDYAANIAQADAGDVQACYVIAQLLIEGKGIVGSWDKAEIYLRKAIAQNHPESMFALAKLLEQKTYNQPFASDAIAAEFRQLLTTAADAGNQDAMIRLAGYLAEGKRSFDKDQPRAYALHLKLAESRYVPSMAIVGRALYTGTLAAKDEAAGLVWIRKAAEANDRNAKQMLTGIEKLSERNSARPPLDAKLDGVTPEILAALATILASPATNIDDAALKVLVDAVWYDAEYSSLDEDLAQELASATRPLIVTSADGQTLSFTKSLESAHVENFGQIIPVNFQPTNLQFYFVMWQRTANAGLLVGGSRVSYQAKSAIVNALAKGLYDTAIKERTKATAELTQYFAALQASHDAASPTVQKEFRALIKSALDTARRATGNQADQPLTAFVNTPWLKEPR